MAMPAGTCPGSASSTTPAANNAANSAKVTSATGTAVCHMGHSPTAATAVADGTSVPSITHSVRRLMAAAGR